jgi:hypothetical protein
MAKIMVAIESGKVTAVEERPVDMVMEVRNYDVGGLPPKL